MLGGLPRSRLTRGNLDGLRSRQDALGQLSGFPTPRTITPTRLDTTDPINVGLAGWWPMNEGKGSVVRDWSLNANHGSMVSMGSVKPSGWGVNDGLRSSGGLWFDGSNDYVSIPHIAALAITGAVSVVQWHYPLNFTAGWWEPLRKYTPSYPRCYSFSIEQTVGRLHFFRGNGSSQTYMSASGVETAMAWNCAIGVNSTTTWATYLNGVKTTATPGSPTVSDDGAALNIGSRGSSCCWFPGSIAHTRIYNRVLTDAEAARIYADPWAGAV